MGSGEFDLIARYFAPLAGSDAPAYGLSDDAAILSPPAGYDLIFTKDALVADVHFFSDDPAGLVAQKALRVNLSDLAAMGAKPLGYLLALSLPKNMNEIESWVSDFTAGLKKDQNEFGWSLLGGDTVSTSGPLTLSVTAIGTVSKGTALRRSGAKVGEGIYVSGTLGDGALGLKCLKDNIDSPSLIKRYHLPTPQLALGQKLSGVASSTLDISDGLAGDIAHICGLSGLGASIESKLIPVSDAAGKILESFPAYNDLIWNGGDDYELLFTAPDHMAEKIKDISASLMLPLTRIGHMTEKPEIVILDDKGKNLLQGQRGFRHF
ncbi:MAG: thiamine-phosphate kinase [Emcibacter sp.]|nr:thiamine-phosphate kinase [Emcibacter sp.]